MSLSRNYTSCNECRSSPCRCSIEQIVQANADAMRMRIRNEDQTDDSTVEPKSDPVDHPAHYTFGKIEVADAIDDWDLSRWRTQVVKYVVRAGRKHKETEVEDLKKAKWYLEREIRRMEGK